MPGSIGPGGVREAGAARIGRLVETPPSRRVLHDVARGGEVGATGATALARRLK
jgi:hypothetical protein